jgi:hypothetical protein
MEAMGTALRFIRGPSRTSVWTRRAPSERKTAASRLAGNTWTSKRLRRAENGGTEHIKAMSPKRYERFLWADEKAAETTRAAPRLSRRVPGA